MTATTPEPVKSTGEMQLGFGGAELFILAGIGLGILALHITVTGGKTRLERSTRVERGADGSQVVTVDEKVSYGISGRLAALIASLASSRA